MPSRPVILVGLLTALPALALADATLRFSGGVGSPDLVQVSGNKVRLEMKAPGGAGKGVMLFDADQKVMYQIDTRGRQYMKMDQNFMQQQAGLMQQMRARMQEQMKNMPPEQRRQMEQMMGAENGQAQAPKIEKTDTRREIDGVACTVYRVQPPASGAPAGEVCLASAEALKISAADYQTLRAMFEHMQQMGEQASGMKGGMAVSEMDGLPIEMRMPGAPQGQAMQLTDVGTQPLAADLFKVPENLREMSLPKQLPQGPGPGANPAPGGDHGDGSPSPSPPQ